MWTVFGLAVQSVKMDSIGTAWGLEYHTDGTIMIAAVIPLFRVTASYIHYVSFFVFENNVPSWNNNHTLPFIRREAAQGQLSLVE